MNKTFPDVPGVYLFKNHANDIIYIGKAKSLKKRVSSYFQDRHDTWKTDNLLKEYADIDYIATSNEIEALLLEAQLIHDYQPKYNVLLKDGQPFLYILFTGLNESKGTSSMELVRNKKKKGVYVGPFMHKIPTRRAFQFLMETFKLYVCNKEIENGCLDYHLGLCAGTCKKNFDTDDYRVRLQLAHDTLKHNRKEFIKTIEKQIELYSQQLAFEKAQQLYDYLDNIDIIFNTLKTKFSEQKFEDRIIAITTPTQLQENKHMLATDLQELFGLDKPVHSIDCFDISHFQSNSLVGSCIRFTDGTPDKNKFRRFMIKTLTQQDDYAALREIVSRRYRNGDLPDLILIDGGKGQLNAVAPLVPRTPCISIAKPNIQHSNEEKIDRLFYSKTQDAIPLDIHSHRGKLLTALRDYAHHFAITYHRKKRNKAFRS
jgi:excinuclease ABC subunit C